MSENIEEQEAPEPVQETNDQPSRSSGEMLPFLILVIILLGTIGVVAWARPLIFGKIVPAVMGEGMEDSAEVDESVDTPRDSDAEEGEDVDGADEEDPDSDEEEMSENDEDGDMESEDGDMESEDGTDVDQDEGEDGEPESDGDSETVNEDGDGDEAEGETAVSEDDAESETVASEEEAETEEKDTALSESETEGETHRIRQGETLRSIAEQYGVTVPELIQANNIANPDYIKVGDELIIPEKTEE